MSPFPNPGVFPVLQKSVLIVAGVLLAVTSFAQFNCVYLQQPELTIGYVDSCAQFWLPSWDDDLGGFYTDVSREGVPTGTSKDMITQSRNAYGLVRAYQMTGEMTYLNAARDALDWMVEHAWDSNYGGYYNDLDNNGDPINPFADKTAFYQHYALLGLASYVQATGDTTMWQRLIEGYAWLDEHMWDDREGLEGYYDNVNYDGDFPNGKSFNATVDAITTHVLLLQLQTLEPAYTDRLEQLAAQIQDHLVASMQDQAIGFAEEYTSNWFVRGSETMTIMGHVLKSAWCLGRVARVTGDYSLLDDAATLFYDVWDYGYDHVYGGPYKDYNRLTGEMLLWGNPDTTKAWWQMEQAVMAGLELNGLLDGPDPLTMADESMDFFMTHFVDREYGEVYADRTRYGALAWNEVKGGDGKAGYHSIETGYYTYLYTNLFVHQQAVTLHFHHDAQNEDHLFRMRPIAAQHGSIRITSILLNGDPVPESNYDDDSVWLLAGQGGHLEVTFEPFPTAVREIVSVQPAGFELAAAYPNPFNGTTQLRFTLQRPETVSVAVYNMMGQRVATVPQTTYTAGIHQMPLTFDGIASGQYAAVLSVEDGTARYVRLTLIR